MLQVGVGRVWVLLLSLDAVTTDVLTAYAASVEGTLGAGRVDWLLSVPCFLIFVTGLLLKY